MTSFRWALVDVETTGLHVTQDRITEIALKILTQRGVELTWHRLINPQRAIPALISSLTGISNDAVAQAPVFEAVAEELISILHDCVLVAHNARFDFGFLKNEFKKAGFSYQSSVICTIKLCKAFYPDMSAYNLPFLATQLQLEAPKSHRALNDVETLYQLIRRMKEEFTVNEVVQKAQHLGQQSSIPSKLTTDIDALPNTPGVYLFYGQNTAIPLYIGKSVTLRQRVLSHFQGDYAHAKEFALAQCVTHVEIIPTAGELGALLLESELIKEKMPIYNRRLRRKKQRVGFKKIIENGYVTLSLVRSSAFEDEPLKTPDAYGAYPSVAAAKTALNHLVKAFNLCQKLCHLERTKTACFSYQLKRCYGACVGVEEAAVYNQRVESALNQYQKQAWPYSGAIAIKEHCPVQQRTQFLIINHWRYLGFIEAEHLLDDWGSLPLKKSACHEDTYKIVQRYLHNATSSLVVIPLEEEVVL